MNLHVVERSNQSPVISFRWHACEDDTVRAYSTVFTELRKRTGIAPGRFAALVGISTTDLMRLECAQMSRDEITGVITDEFIECVAEVTGVSAAGILDRIATAILMLNGYQEDGRDCDGEMRLA